MSEGTIAISTKCTQLNYPLSSYSSFRVNCVLWGEFIDTAAINYPTTRLKQQCIVVCFIYEEVVSQRGGKWKYDVTNEPVGGKWKRSGSNLLDSCVFLVCIKTKGIGCYSTELSDHSSRVITKRGELLPGVGELYIMGWWFLIQLCEHHK